MSTSVFDVKIDSDETAVSVLRYFLDTAAKRGAYSLPEAARIMEALNHFENKEAPASANS